MFTSWVTKFNSLLFERVNIRIIDSNKAPFFVCVCGEWGGWIGKAFYVQQLPLRKFNSTSILEYATQRIPFNLLFCCGSDKDVASSHA